MAARFLKIGRSPKSGTVLNPAGERGAIMSSIPNVQRAVSVLWPSFLMAGAATVVLFTAFDPLELSLCLGAEGIDRVGAYTVGFFMLWLLTVSSSILTLYFQRPCHTPVERPFADDG
jgi:hypothetical protein